MDVRRTCRLWRGSSRTTSLGRTIFLRACTWAMGETLEPYQGLGIIDIGLIGPYRIKLSWQGLPDKNFRIVGTTDFTNWTSVVDSIIGGTNGTVSRTLDVSLAPHAAFMRVAAVP